MAANAARAGMHAFNTARLSRSTAGGKVGRSLKGCSGNQVMAIFSSFDDTSPSYVVTNDMSRKRVAFRPFWRHDYPLTTPPSTRLPSNVTDSTDLNQIKHGHRFDVRGMREHVDHARLFQHVAKPRG
ncbi:hypothetical protein LP420_32415 [Massilia sp. B-10]|nr:hypothetical protein LP420_32415 [Massilia sp. B-10]